MAYAMPNVSQVKPPAKNAVQNVRIRPFINWSALCRRSWPKRYPSVSFQGSYEISDGNVIIGKGLGAAVDIFLRAAGPQQACRFTFPARRLDDPGAGQSFDGAMMQRILERAAVPNPVVRLFCKAIPYGAPFGAVAALFFLLAGSVQGGSYERPLQRQEVLAASRIVFCSGHPDIAIEHMRQAVSNWHVGSKSVVPGTSFRKGTDSSDAFFVIVEDDSFEPTLSDCIATYPEPMKNALAGVVGMIGQPVPDYSPIAKYLGPIAGTGASLRGDGWIGKIMVSAFHGEDARASLNDVLGPVH